MTLNVYAEPLRPKLVDEIETAEVLAVLRPIWLRSLRQPPAFAGE